MIRRTFGTIAVLLLLSVAAPVAAAQSVVGHLPPQSPYQDLSGRHLASMQVGWILPANDPAGVGPRGGLVLIGRYEYDFGGPLILTSRTGIAPGLERTVKDPMLGGTLRNAGTQTEPLFFMDGGLALSITGDKAWHGINPRIHTSIGLVSSLNSDFDLGGYRFGPKMIWSWGFSARGLRTGALEWNADATWAWWRMNYPSIYKDSVSTNGNEILSRGRLNPWNGNVLLTFGVTRVYRR